MSRARLLIVFGLLPLVLSACSLTSRTPAAVTTTASPHPTATLASATPTAIPSGPPPDNTRTPTLVPATQTAIAVQVFGELTAEARLRQSHTPTSTRTATATRKLTATLPPPARYSWPFATPSVTISSSGWETRTIEAFGAEHPTWGIGNQLRNLEPFVFLDPLPESLKASVMEKATNPSGTIEASSTGYVVSYCPFHETVFPSLTCEWLAHENKDASAAGADVMAFELHLRDVKAGRMYVLDWYPRYLYYRPIFRFKWRAEDLVTFEIWAQPHYGGLYALHFGEQRFVLLSLIGDEFWQQQFKP